MDTKGSWQKGFCHGWTRNLGVSRLNLIKEPWKTLKVLPFLTLGQKYTKLGHKNHKIKQIDGFSLSLEHYKQHKFRKESNTKLKIGKYWI